METASAKPDGRGGVTLHFGDPARLHTKKALVLQLTLRADESWDGYLVARCEMTEEKGYYYGDTPVSVRKSAPALPAPPTLNPGLPTGADRLSVEYEDLWFIVKGGGGDSPLGGVRELELVNLTDEDLTIDVEAVWSRDGQELRVPAGERAGKVTIPARGREILTLQFRVSARAFKKRGRTWFLGADEALEVRDVSRSMLLARIPYSDGERFRELVAEHGDRFREALELMRKENPPSELDDETGDPPPER